jgi:Glycosyltransferase
MKVYYHLSDYISHRRAGEAYMACLRKLGHELVRGPDESDLVIVHDEPLHYASILRDISRAPGRKFVGYAVWETPQLPQRFIDGVRLVDAVWTCSEFSRRAFSPHVAARLLPHVVERPKVSPRDMDWAVNRLGMTEQRQDRFYYYTIVDSANPRKNILAMLAAFASAFSGRDDTVRLVIKQYRVPQDFSGFPFVVDVPEKLTDGQIAALHAVCDAYVSTHHAEAWGLPLSEAMSFGNPVIATGYSGNMEFMTPENSFPVPYTIAPVGDPICRALPDLFSPGMTWADIDAVALAQTLRNVRMRPVSREFCAYAAFSMKAFSSDAVCDRLAALLASL